ncbi:hypothetical protein [Sphingopyxis sp. KK2]|uniref:hypothetical protein n=1 Tax=Sphingopyxis sp. KK2 TaxID=1855727 RepID=UPI001181776E|nr:hypothetical protein [Sphingopyxis sp. KK2]
MREGVIPFTPPSGEGMHIMTCKRCGAGLSRPVLRVLCEDAESRILGAGDWPVVLAYEFQCERKSPRGYIYPPDARHVTAFWLHPDAIVTGAVLDDRALDEPLPEEHYDPVLHCGCGQRFASFESIFDAVPHVEVHEPDIQWKPEEK